MDSLSSLATKPENDGTLSNSKNNTTNKVSTTSSSIPTCIPSSPFSPLHLHTSSPLSFPSIKDSAIHLTDISSTPSSSSSSSSTTTTFSYPSEPSSLEEGPFTSLPTDLYLPIIPHQPTHVRFQGPKTSLSLTAKIAMLTAAVACSKHVRHIDVEQCLSSWLNDVSLLSNALEVSESTSNHFKQSIGTHLGTISHLRQELTQVQYQLEQTQLELEKSHQCLQEHQFKAHQHQTHLNQCQLEIQSLRHRLFEVEQTATLFSQQVLQLQSQLRSMHSSEDIQRMKEHYFNVLEQRDREHATLINQLCFLCRKQVGRF